MKYTIGEKDIQYYHYEFTLIGLKCFLRLMNVSYQYIKIKTSILNENSVTQ